MSSHEFAATVSCGDCRAPLKERSDIPVKEREPCSRCGSTARHFGVHIQSTVGIESHIDRHSKHRREPKTKPHREEWHGDSWNRDRGRYVRRGQIVDRENDRYHKRVVDPMTNEVLREVEKRLSDHTGHRAAKHPPDE